MTRDRADGWFVALDKAEPETADVMTVTVGPEARSTDPTTTPIFVADLAAA